MFRQILNFHFFHPIFSFYSDESRTSPSVDGGSATMPGLVNEQLFSHNIWPFEEKIKKSAALRFFHMATLHNSMWYQHNPMKTVGRVRESMKKTTKNDKFFPRCDLDLDRVTLKPMPGYSCIQGQYTLQVSWNIDNGKVVKNPGQTDGRTSIMLDYKAL